MKRIIYFLLIPLIFLSCFNKQKEGSINNPASSIESDTLVCRRDLMNEVAGSAYMERATGYSLITYPDTSDFEVEFTESNEKGKVSMSIHYDQYNRKGKSFSTRLNELKLILPSVKTDYNLDSLSSISVGRLVSTGDLAIDITKEYQKKYGNNYHISDYKIISDFLRESPLSREFNTLLRPYSIQVINIVVEKVFFTTRKDLYYSSLVEADSSLVPERILDCITWIILEPLK